VDPKLEETEQAYLYVNDDPVKGTDASGDCVKVFSFCIGGGPETSAISLRFDPGAGVNAYVNIGRGASFGLSDKIANWVHRGASRTVPGNSFDQFLGAAGTSLVGGELLRGVLSAPEMQELTHVPPEFDPETWGYREAARPSVLENHFWDPEGGEWGWHEDQWREGHWDYNSWDQWNSDWAHR
jgi:hypothetical protein